MFDHLSIGVTDLARAAAFYDAVLGPLGYARLSENPRAVCYGPAGFVGEAPFAILQLRDGESAGDARMHLAFAAGSRAAVVEFHRAALAAGGTDDGAPGVRENYDPGYFAAFVLDLDGRRLEAVVHEVVERQS